MTADHSDGPEAGVDQNCDHDPQRRMLLTGLAAAYLSSFISAVDAQPAADAGWDTFHKISAFLTGRPSLDPEQSKRLYEALAADSPQFEAEVQGLLTLVNDRKIDAALLQQVLDGEGSALASLPRKIMTAWYTGIVGEGRAARCITFETSLMHQLVADRLSPPSYCYGPHGSWAEAPV
jgi:Membrane bound FAD containing D-sorbitol dehydrogenase